MIRTLAAIVGAMCALAAPAQAQGAAEETPAIPIDRRPPAYPAECMAKADNETSRDYVILVLDIDKRGYVQNVRVRESSDPCFEAVAVATARDWQYEPRRVGNARAEQTDMEVTLTFILNSETLADDFDARPRVRVPPQYPAKCMRGADDSESVLVRFDVDELGETRNIEIVESTNKCLNASAIASVERWKYMPKTVEGQAVVRRGVETVLRFQLSSSLPNKEYQMRPRVERKLLRAQRLSRDPQTADEADTVLDEIYAEYGQSFSQLELSAYHQIRAVVKINKKEYAAALDSLRIVHRLALAPEETRKAIETTIYQLEAALAAGPTAPQTDGQDAPTQTEEQ
ncbi:MAG: TonB family protein [Parvularculaceae bacterium]